AVVEEEDQRQRQPGRPVGQRGVRGDLLLDLVAAGVVQLPELIVQQQVVGVHRNYSLPSCLAARARSWSLVRAACRRDFTVPTGMSRISAISRYFRSWK